MMAHVIPALEENQYDTNFPDLEGARKFAGTGLNFYKEFKRTGALGDLEKAIKIFQEVVSLIPDGHYDKPGWLNNLGMSLMRRFEHTGMLSDLEEAIKYKQQVVSLTPDGHDNKPAWLSTLGRSFKRRFEYTGMPSDLEEAITHQRQAVLIAPDDHIVKPELLSILGTSLESRFWRTGLPSDIKEAIKYHEQAVLLTPDGPTSKPSRFNNLGVAYMSLFERTGILNDLEKAIKNLRQAELLTPDGDANKPMSLNNLGSTLSMLFEYTGMLSNVDEAIKYQQQAVLLLPDGHPDKPGWLTNLGGSFERRFGRTGMLSDLEAAIANHQQAVLLTSDGHANKPTVLSNLGTSLSSRFMRTGMLSDLEGAIKNHQQAVFLTPDGHASKPMWLNNLGISFQRRFIGAGMVSDLEEAIKNQQHAVSLTPDGHASKPSWLNNLGISFESLFRSTRRSSDIDAAIKCFQQAVLLTPEHNANKPARLNNLGMAFQTRFYHTGSSNDLDSAISNLVSATASSIGPPLLRCRASRRCARLEVWRDPLSAIVAYRTTIGLLPQIAWIGDPIDARHSQLNDLDDIPREAAAFALDVSNPGLALEWLEQGRSVVWTQLFNLRTPVHDLSREHPDICAEFTQVSHELQSAATRGHGAKEPSADLKISLEQETQHHHRLAERWDTLVKKIRLLQGFEDFLLPKKISVLKKAACSGPVVVINVHKSRCDALVLDQNRDRVVHIPLDKLRYEDAEKMQKSLREDLANPRLAQRWEDRAGAPVSVGGSRMERILETIYLNIVYPILQGLDLTTCQPDPLNLPRIWWCPTGPLTFLPLHAACRKTATGIQGVFDYVVSSYIPTVNALLEARAANRRPFGQLVGIAMSNTPGQSPLPGAEKELERIEKLFPADSIWKFEVVQNEEATGERVLADMANSSWVHLACHAVQDVREPTRSGFCLHDQRLTITDIISKPFANADLAFLSACETATGDERASDEAVHITGAMLGAGYRSVIGTMWSIPDAAAPIIAEKVYENLLSGEPNSERAARALHEAVRELRTSSHGSFNSWVPFVHYGV